MSGGKDAVPGRIDRTLSLSILFAIFVQTAGALLWTGAAAARLESLEGQAEAARNVNERLARIETQITMTRQTMTRIEARIDRVPNDRGTQ